MKQIVRRAAAVSVAAVLFLFVSCAAGTLLMPVRRDYGSTWETFLREPENSVDVMFFGSSLVYCDVIPAAIWEETGLCAYVMAGPEQTIPISYYYLKEACRTQQPQAICVELTGMFYARFQNYTKVNVGYMPWGVNRIAATFRASESEQRLGLLFPLYAYHDRIYSVTREDIRSHLKPGTDIYAGYTYLTDSKPQGGTVYRDFSAETETYRQNLDYLKKIAAYCKKSGIRLICYIAPCVNQIPDDARKTLEMDLSEIDCVYYNCNDAAQWPELTGLDSETVWYDSLHYNVKGAIPFSRAFGTRLKEQGLTVRPSDTALWQKRVEAMKKPTD